jgi:transposase
MLGLPLGARVLVSRAAVDFRKAHDGLVAVVRDAFRDDPLSGDLFVFFNRRRDRIKVLVWDRNGFWLLYKRLERGTFEALAIEGDVARAEIDRVRLAMLLEGVAQKSVRFRRNFAARVGITARRDEQHAAAAG